MYILNTPLFYKTVFCLYLSLFLYLVVFLTPNTDVILDRSNYFVSISNSQERWSLLDFSSGYVIFSEPLYIFLTSFLSRFFTVETSLLIIISLAAIMTLVPIFIRKPKLLFIIILIFLMPQVLSKYIVHIRQGLAIGLFFTFYFGLNRGLVLSSFIAGLVHVSFFIVLPIAILSNISKSNRVLNTQISLLILFFGFLLLKSEYIIQLFSMVELRQINKYVFQSGNVSGLAFIYWISIFILLLISKNFSEKAILARNVIAVYCASYFSISFISRFIESFIPLIFIELHNVNKQIAYAAVIFFLITSWIREFGKPLLGFGA